MKVKLMKSFRGKMIMYMLLSMLATLVTEGIIFVCIYFYETNILAGEYRRVWGAYGQGSMSVAMFLNTQSLPLDIFVVTIFSVLLLVMYFILFTHRFVSYVREILNGLEHMKSGELVDEIPVRGDDEFAEIAASINEMRENLSVTLENQRNTEKMKDEMITNVAHDLRTPLTSILGYLDLLTQGDMLTKEQQQKYLGIVSNKARQLETLIKDLFDYTRYDKNKVRIKKEILDLNLFMPQIVEEFYPSFEENHLECRTDFYQGALNIEANGDLLARAIGNLMSNAIKYGADGKVVEVKTGILDETEERGKMIYVSVVNYGKIIPAEDLDKIFDKFYRVEGSRSLKTGGTGLGLAIAKNIVNLHNGRIWASSDENGTKFTIELPMIRRTQEAEHK
ncbi:MAG: HAMP domain-containing sensor histidine kinase [Lachnospiraceae bacterium]|nr:HAMP domain-containing sensor histidine kinase [Lachnospiraceae bacterium]